MLVLSRYPLEEIVLDGGRIRITVISVRGGKVRLGVSAPADVAVDRAEVHERRQEFAAAGEVNALPN